MHRGAGADGDWAKRLLALNLPDVPERNSENSGQWNLARVLLELSTNGAAYVSLGQRPRDSIKGRTVGAG
jgi:hypothetical protein